MTPSDDKPEEPSFPAPPNAKAEHGKKAALEPEPEKKAEPEPVAAAEPPVASAAAAVTPLSPEEKGELVPLIRGRLPAFAAAAVSGLLYFVAFAGVDIWPLTFVCLVPLYVALEGQSPKRATQLGLITGLMMNVSGFYWLVNMLKTFSGFPLPLCILFTVIISAYQGGRLALLGWLHGRATARGWPAPIVFTLAFAASELVYPLLFPWYYAATVHGVPVLMQLADLGGPILVGLVLVAVNLAIAEPVRGWLAKRQGRALQLDRRVVIAGAAALAVSFVYGLVRTKMTDSRVEAAESAHVGFVQGNMALLAKRENPGEGLRRHRALTAELKAKGAEFVVWSETSATFPVKEEMAMEGHFFRQSFAATLGVPTIFGAVLYRKDADRERWFNTAIATDVAGEIKGRYDKQYLLAFGEYLPFGDTFPILYKWSPHSGRFSAGNSLEPVIVSTKGTEHKVSVLICYEDILPGFTNRAVSHADPELLVNMTNDAWFGDTTEPWQHLALAKFRAVEHRRFLVRSTNSGVSAIIDPNGRVVPGTVSTPFKIETHDGIIRWLRGTTVYEVLGDVPWYLATMAIVIAAFRRRRSKSGYDRDVRGPGATAA